MSSDLNRKQILDVVCPHCREGNLMQRGDSVFWVCSNCARKLSCLSCGGTRSLKFHKQKSGERYVHCSVCGETYWDSSMSPAVQKSKPKPKSSGFLTPEKLENCAYCGGGDNECHYCHGRSRACPKCTSRNLVKAGDNTALCLTCHLEFPLVPPTRTSSLITDPKTIRQLASLLTQCPKCHGNDISPHSDGQHCRSCGATWCPSSVQDDVKSDHTIAFWDDKFWDQCCSKCGAYGLIARHANSRLECFNCGHTWKGDLALQQMTQIGAESTRIQTGAKSTSPPKLSRSVCSHCRDGFLDELTHRCYRCGKTT